MDEWGWIVLLLAVLLLGGLGYMAWQQRREATSSKGLGRNDRFAPAAALSAAEMELLDYLVRAFPGRAVLFREALSNLVTVRKTGSRAAVQQRLAEHSVDYVVCDRDGRPVFAFELDALHTTADEAEQDAREKHRVLKSAGIRLIRLTRTTRDLPSPGEFRRLVRSAELTEDGSPAAVTGPGALAPADGDQPATRPAPPQLHDLPVPGRSGGFRDTQPMTVTGLMDLAPASDKQAGTANDDWGIRSRSR
jgi:hypothetical protein